MFAEQQPVSSFRETEQKTTEKSKKEIRKYSALKIRTCNRSSPNHQNQMSKTWEAYQPLFAWIKISCSVLSIAPGLDFLTNSIDFSAEKPRWHNKRAAIVPERPSPPLQ